MRCVKEREREREGGRSREEHYAPILPCVSLLTSKIFAKLARGIFYVRDI